MPVCQRSFLKRMVKSAEDAGLSFRMTLEVEFTLLDENLAPLSNAPGYSPRKFLPASDFVLDLLDAAQKEGIPVVQIHPEYAFWGNTSFPWRPGSPLEAADRYTLLRQTICRVAYIHGLHAAFTPTVIPGEVGNGCHLHFSAYEEGQNLFTGGTGPEDLTAKGEAAAAGVLDRLPEMMGVLASSVLSYDRLQPSHWSGAFTCWGWENREAALRLIKGMEGSRESSTNFELKCLDGTANAYLACGVVIAAALDGIQRGLTLPPSTCLDPVNIPEDQREKMGIFRLPDSLDKAILQMERTDFLKKCMKDPLFNAYIATRRFDWETYKDMPMEEMVKDLRFRFG